MSTCTHDVPLVVGHEEAEPDTSIAKSIAMPRYNTVSAMPLLYALPLGVKPRIMSSAK